VRPATAMAAMDAAAGATDEATHQGAVEIYASSE
jgi:hypothetical protein